MGISEGRTPMRRQLKRTRRGRQQGSALVVAVVMLFVIVATIELMLAAPNAELNKVKSTVAKEHSQASGNAGIMDAACWMYAHATNLSTYMDDPTTSSPRTLAAGKNIVLTSQTALAANNTGGNGDGAAATFALQSTSSFNSQVGPISVNTTGSRAGL